MGINGKLSEFHAAVGLAALDLWVNTKNAYYQKAAFFLDIARNIPIRFQKGWGINWISSTCVILFEDEHQKQIAQQNWTAQKIHTRNWWNQGCHLEPAFAHYQFIDLYGNTNTLANNTLGIPFFRDITKSSIDSIFDSIKNTS
jgi:dTDP-4-amino-4,6-dideoxygalactose transaminase